MAGATLHEDGHPRKRRKVRKGTQSCWECRQRRVRCIFAAPTDAICENCRRRATVCVRQDHPDGPVPTSGSNQVGTRLGRVEELIEHLVRGAGTVQIPKSPAKVLSQGHLSDLAQREPRPLADPMSDRGADIPTPPTSVRNTGESTNPTPSLKRPSPATITSPVQIKQDTGKYEELCSALTAAWPSQHDIDLICALPVGLSAHLHSGICTPYSSSMGWDPPSPRKLLQLPPPGSHPVLIARKLLVLGTFLQAVLPSSIRDMADLGASYHNIMAHVVDTAIRLVTTDEDLISSVEGIECIMIEAMYQNYAGNLHRAWMAVRRATTVAQMIALHRGLNSPSLKILEPETRATFDPDQICFRLVELDGYLCLMLGLPWTPLETRFATPKALEECHPIDRMQRIHCAMADRILQRDENDLYETHDIDLILQEAAALRTPQWWLIPNISACNSSGTEIVHETVRFMDQFVHYHLLIRLHLPYMLRSSHDRIYHHSKITAVNVSRETLARFVAFRTSNTAHFYCRGTDYFAFIATTVLCFAHIESRGRGQDAARTSNAGTVFNSLAHSRPSDRGMMERTLEIIESMARSGTDAISSKIARILRPLLAIEAKAASGTSYITNSSKGDEEHLECHGKLTTGGMGVHVHIPFIGTINFERRTISEPTSTAPMASEESLSTTLVADMPRFDQLDEYNQLSPSNPDCAPAYEIGSEWNYNNTEGTHLHFGQPAPPQQPTSPGSGFSSFNSGGIEESQSADLGDAAYFQDDMDMQGVDVALFDSLFRGTAFPDAVEEEPWTQWFGIAEFLMLEGGLLLISTRDPTIFGQTFPPERRRSALHPFLARLGALLHPFPHPHPACFRLFPRRLTLLLPLSFACVLGTFVRLVLVCLRQPPRSVRGFPVALERLLPSVGPVKKTHPVFLSTPDAFTFHGALEALLGHSIPNIVCYDLALSRTGIACLRSAIGHNGAHQTARPVRRLLVRNSFIGILLYSFRYGLPVPACITIDRPVRSRCAIGENVYNSKYSAANASSITPCNQDLSITSTCCLAGETCGADNLCRGNAGGVYRQYCTDPTWESTNCSQLCPQFDAAGVELTPCPDGSYCCGYENHNCCAAGQGTFINAQGQILLGSDGQVSSISGVTYSTSMTSTSFSTSTFATAPTPSANSPSNPTTGSSSTTNLGAIIGGAIGGVAVLLLAVILVLLVLRHRKKKEDDSGFKNQIGSPYQYSAMVDGGATPSYLHQHYQEAPEHGSRERAELMSTPRFEMDGGGSKRSR